MSDTHEISPRLGFVVKTDRKRLPVCSIRKHALSSQIKQSVSCKSSKYEHDHSSEHLVFSCFTPPTM